MYIFDKKYDDKFFDIFHVFEIKESPELTTTLDSLSFSIAKERILL